MKKLILYFTTILALHAYNYGTYEGNVAGCENGNPKACNDLAGMYLTGEEKYKIHEDEAKAKKFYDKSIELYKQKCFGKDAKACFDLGDKYAGTRWGIKQDYKMLVKYYTKSCEYGYGKACNELGAFYKRAMCGVKKDINKSKKMYDRAIALYKQECKNENASSCNWLGTIYLMEMYGTKNEGQSTKYYKKAFELNKTNCNNNDPEGCYQIALKYFVGAEYMGIQQNIDLAYKFFKKSCELGESSACYKAEDIAKEI